MRLSVLVLLGLAAVAAGAGVARGGGPEFEPDYAVGGFGIGRETFDRPVDVVEDRDENIYVLEQGNNRIQVLDRRGRFVKMWGSRGARPGLLDTPAAMVFDTDGNLLVVDTLNHRIQKFDPRASNPDTPLMVLGRFGSGKGEFNKPSDVAVDRNGNIYVADTGNNRVQKFDRSGRFMVEWGKFAYRGRGAGIDTPVSIGYADEGYGYLYVIDQAGCRVDKFEADGTVSRSWDLYRKGEGAVCGPARVRVESRRYTVYIADTENGRVILFDRQGEPLGELKGGDKPFRKPAGLSLNDVFNEVLLVADTGNNLIQKFRRTR